MNTTTKKQEKKEIIKLGIYFAIWVLLTVALYHIVTR